MEQPEQEGSAGLPKEEMYFGIALRRPRDFILGEELDIGPTFLSNVDLADAYMRIWVRLSDVPTVVFLVPK